MAEPPRLTVLSVNVSLARPMAYRGTTVSTGIYKEPVPGRVPVGALGLRGDEQADRRVHGGPRKAVYAYPSEHYDFWKREFPGMTLPWGFFGENLTTEGLREDTVRVGDLYRIGTAVLEVTQPRFPCFKLAMKFDREDILDRFLRSGRSGFYSSVAQPGHVAAGDRIEPIRTTGEAPTIAEVVQARIRREDAGE